MATAVESHRPAGWRRLFSFPIVFTGLAVLIFFFYEVVLGRLVAPVQTFVGGWFPLNGINQCLIWAMLAVGLNIVVGYAGLLDLGYVAFWAIGGYGAGGGISPLFSPWGGNNFWAGAPGPGAGVPPGSCFRAPPLGAPSPAG